MRCFVMFVTAVCVLFLLKLKWSKNKSFYDEVRYFSRFSDRALVLCFEAWGSAMSISRRIRKGTDQTVVGVRVCHLLLLLSEKLGLSRNGRMERNFPVIPIFRNFRPISWGTPKISEWKLGKCLFHSLPHPEFSEVLVEWEAAPPISLPSRVLGMPIWSSHRMPMSRRKKRFSISISHPECTWYAKFHKKLLQTDENMGPRTPPGRV